MRAACDAVPLRGSNADLARLAHLVRSHITKNELAASQLPRVVPGRNPTIKPESWYARPDLIDQKPNSPRQSLGGRGKAFKWMEQANPRLDGMAPIDLAESDAGAARVIAYIQQYIAEKASGNNGP